MTKNKPVSEENKAVIREEVKKARRDGKPTLASIAKAHGIHPTMISKIAPVKAMKPKRRTARKAVKAVPVDRMDKLVAEYRKLQARQMEIEKEMTKLFFDRILEQD